MCHGRCGLLTASLKRISDPGLPGFERFAGGQLITLFSATNYCGTANNAGAILVLGRDMVLYPKVSDLSLSLIRRTSSDATTQLIHPLPPPISSLEDDGPMASRGTFGGTLFVVALASQASTPRLPWLLVVSGWHSRAPGGHVDAVREPRPAAHTTARPRPLWFARRPGAEHVLRRQSMAFFTR